MQRRPSLRYPVPVAASLVLAAVVSGPVCHAASKRLQWGPFEVIPSAGLGIRNHSNVYVSSNTDELEQRGVNFSGILIDINAGVLFKLVPPRQLQQSLEIRGIHLDAYYRPNVSFFPNASPNIVLFGGDREALEVRGIDPDHKPDLFKFTQQFGAGFRWQMSPHLTTSAGVVGDQPEVSAVDDRFFDLNWRAGVMWLPTQRVGVELNGNYRSFDETARTSDGEKINSPLGTFDETRVSLAGYWIQSPTLRFIVDGTWRKRVFGSDAFSHPDFQTRPDQAPNDFNGDGIPDIGKDYEQTDLYFRVHKRLSRQVEGQAYVGYVDRQWDVRNFGAEKADGIVGGGWVSSLLSKRTRIQASAEYIITDTIRDLTFEDINAFTSDELGAFTVIDNSYTEVWSQRYIVDLVQQVSKRGDQILAGFAYEKADLSDKQSTQNFFVRIVDPSGEYAPEDRPRNLELEGCAGGYCDTIEPDKRQRQYIVSGGYRYRMTDWLGVQAKVAYYDRTEDIDPMYGLDRQALEQGEIRQIPIRPAQRLQTDYWSVSFGFVFNLRVF